MKNTKDITISIFAVIGFVAIITAFTNQPEQANQTTTPESHVWEAIQNADGATSGRIYLYNKVTGEMRKMQNGIINLNDYAVMEERVPKEKKKKKK